jgi:hypothetical protein
MDSGKKTINNTITITTTVGYSHTIHYVTNIHNFYPNKDQLYDQLKNIKKIEK